MILMSKVLKEQMETTGRYFLPAHLKAAALLIQSLKPLSTSNVAFPLSSEQDKSYLAGKSH